MATATTTLQDHIREAEMRIAHAIGRELLDIERRFVVRPTALSISIADVGVPNPRPLYFVERCRFEL